MNNIKKQKNKKTKKNKKLIIFKILLVIVFFVFSFLVVNTILNVININNQLKAKQEELHNMQLKRDMCNNELKLLDSDEYIEQVLRDDYFFLKDNELFFLIPELNKDNGQT